MPIAFVQDDSAGANNSSGTIAVTFGTNPTAGNFIAVFASWDGDTTATCADSQSNSYTESVTLVTGDDRCSHFYAFNITGGANTVTVTFSANSSFRRIIVHEYSGVQTSSDPKDVTSSNTATSTNATSGAATTTQANDLIFGTLSTFNNVSVTAGTGFTMRIVGQSNSANSEDLLDAGAAASEEVSFVHDSVQWQCLMSTFFIAAAGGLGIPLVMHHRSKNLGVS